MGLVNRVGVKIFEFTSLDDNGPSELEVSLRVNPFLDEKELELDDVQMTSAVHSQLMPPRPGSGSDRPVTVRTTLYTIFYNRKYGKD